MTSPQEKSVYSSPLKIDAKTPFAGDCFGREAHADRLTNLINRLPDGGVIAIDAPWGEGKSWFGENWRNKLAMGGYRTAYINAFERDYVEDPFIMLVAEILKAVVPDSTTGKKLKASAIQLTKALAPTLGKVSINLVGKLLGTTDIVGEYEEQISKIADGVADAAKQHISKRLEDYEKDRKSVKSFGVKLAQCAEIQVKPIVIFIDELDRCRPDFGVKTIERIKHFFETKNVVFVLLVNKSQLHSAIKGLYGQINAEEYLSKFLHVTLTLPKELNLNYLNNDDNTKYCRVVLSRHGYLPADEFTDKWAILIGALATSFGMSLREIERCVSLYTLCNFTTKLSVYTAWPIFLKIKKPAIFQGIKNSTQSSNQDAADLLSPLCTEDNQMKHFFERLVELHKVCAQAKDLHSTRDFNLGGAAPYEHGFHSWSELLPYYCRLIECSV